MRNGLLWTLLVAALLALLAAGCGGSGGGTGGNTGAVVGRVLDVLTGGPPAPPATVQIGSRSTLTATNDGSFTLNNVPEGTTSLTVDNGIPPLWTFSIPPVSGTTDVGDLWVGPERVNVTGTVRDASTQAPIAGATVRFAGRVATTNGSGIFTLVDVAYSSQTQTAFWGIIGEATAPNYFRNEWTASPHTANGGVVTVNDILLTPTSDPTPPGPPFNIWGMVSAPGGPSGAIVRLKQNGNDVRVVNVGSDGRYAFFVVPGSYVISASKGASTAPDIPVTLNQPNQVIRQDVTIP